MSTTTQPPTPQSTAPPNQKPNGSATPTVTREILLSAIQPSKTNPRKTFDTAADAELVASIKQVGVLQAILVRPGPQGPNGHLELVAGERRYRAAKIAGLSSIPATIRELTDDQAMRVQIIENLQRKDVSALEEGQGYRQLLNARSKSDPKDVQGLQRQKAVEQIAKEVGKSVRYVYARMKLTELIPELIADLAAGTITASHADELVRLCAKDQAEFRDTHLFTHSYEEGTPGFRGYARSVRYIKDQIERGYQLDLKKAGFPTDDPSLVPAAGACGTCLKNSLNSPLSDADKKKAMCMDRACFAGKVAAFVKIDAVTLSVNTNEQNRPVLKVTPQHSLDYERSKSKDKPLVRSEWKSAKPGECDSVQPAMVVDISGLHDQAVKAKLVCMNQKCKVHFAPKSSSASSSKSSSSSPVSSAAKKMTLEDLREENNEQFAAQRKTLVLTHASLQALLKVDKLLEDDMRFILNRLEDGGGYSFDSVLRHFGLGPWRKAKAQELPRYVVAAAFSQDLDDLQNGDEPYNNGLELFIKGRGVNLEKVGAEIEQKIKRCSICGCFEGSACRLPGTAGPCTWLAPKNSFGQKHLCSNPLCKSEAERLAQGTRVAEIEAGLGKAFPKLKAKSGKSASAKKVAKKSAKKAGRK